MATSVLFYERTKVSRITERF